MDCHTTLDSCLAAIDGSQTAIDSCLAVAGSSLTTIGRVARFLFDGANGYKVALERIKTNGRKN